MVIDTEITTNVYIDEYQVVPESAVDIIDNLTSGYCPICSEENSPSFTMPKIGESSEWLCVDCNITILVEVWKAQ